MLSDALNKTTWIKQNHTIFLLSTFECLSIAVVFSDSMFLYGPIIFFKCGPNDLLALRISLIICYVIYYI